MNNKKLTRKIVRGLCLVCLSLSMLLSPLSSFPVQAAGNEETMIQPYKDDIQWRWKIENNKLYKRLFNYSTAEWVGEWIYVCDVS